MNLGSYEILLLLFVIIPPVIALIGIQRNSFKKPNDRILWVIIVACFPFKGVLFYVIMGRKNRIINN
jgi:hypothetical protein